MYGNFLCKNRNYYMQFKAIIKKREISDVQDTKALNHEKAYTTKSSQQYRDYVFSSEK